ncbi:MAG: hypothetical protein GYA55_08560, partial [SAR324 cluster bacterium]|nr:hypothetical protein [SAR324 cluster bacterium]
MTERYVIDTTSIICYFHDVFQQRDRLSDKARKLLGQAFSTDSGSVKLSIPSIVFVEIYDKWITDEEFARKFFYEVYTPIGQSPNIEVKPIEREVLE